MPLTRQELLARLPLHEDSYVERKPEGGELKEALVAFANSVPFGREAVLFIGVADGGAIVGVSNGDALQKKIRTICTRSVYPPIDFTTELLTLEGKEVLAVVVPPSNRKPHFAGPAYVRVGSETVIASEPQFDDLIASRHSLVAALQKMRNMPIVVVSNKYALGKPENESIRAGTVHRPGFTRHDCTLLEVNPHFARFETRGTRFAEPLRNLVLSFDEEVNKPLIIVRLDGV